MHMKFASKHDMFVTETELAGSKHSVGSVPQRKKCRNSTQCAALTKDWPSSEGATRDVLMNQSKMILDCNCFVKQNWVCLPLFMEPVDEGQNI